MNKVKYKHVGPRRVPPSVVEVLAKVVPAKELTTTVQRLKNGRPSEINFTEKGRKK